MHCMRFVVTSFILWVQIVDSISWVAKNVYTQREGSNLAVEPWRLTALVATTDASNLRMQREFNAIKLKWDLEENVKFIKYQQSQTGRVPPALDKTYHELHRNLSKAMGLESELPGWSFLWLVSNASWSHSHKGRTLRIFFNATGNYSLRLEAKHNTNVEVLEGVADCQYVRREITELTSDERGRFFSAVKTMYSTPTKRGRQHYGPAYRGMQEMWFLHNLLGSMGAAGETPQLGHSSASGLVPTIQASSSNTKSWKEEQAGVVMEVTADENDYSTLKTWTGNPQGDDETRMETCQEGSTGGEQCQSTAVAAFQEEMDSVQGVIEALENKTTMSGVYTKLFDKAVQAVDPAILPPFFDPAKNQRHRPRVIRWREKVRPGNDLSEMPLMLGHASDLGKPPRPSGQVAASDTAAHRTVQSDFAMLPLVDGTHVKTNFDGSKTSVQKAFSIPVAAMPETDSAS